MDKWRIYQYDGNTLLMWSSISHVKTLLNNLKRLTDPARVGGRLSKIHIYKNGVLIAKIFPKQVKEHFYAY